MTVKRDRTEQATCSKRCWSRVCSPSWWKATSVLAAIVVTVAGCVVPPLTKSDPDFPEGSTLVLHQPQSVPTGEAGAYLSRGVGETRYQYQITCRLEVRTLSKGQTVIQPDRFTVLGTSYARDSLTGPAYPGPLDSFNSVGDGGGLVYMETLIYLHSQLQPDVLRLKCRQLQDNEFARYLSGEQIRAALGDTMTFER